MARRIPSGKLPPLNLSLPGCTLGVDAPRASGPPAVRARDLADRAGRWGGGERVVEFAVTPPARRSMAATGVPHHLPSETNRGAGIATLGACILTQPSTSVVRITFSTIP